MGTLATFLVACLFLSIYIPSNYGFSVGRSRRDADGTIEGLPSSWLTKRVRRDEDHSHVDHHGSHKLEDYFKNHLSWLTDTQKDELKTLKAEGKSRKELQDKVFEYYEGTTGETKEKATELLRGGCKELLTTVIGPEKTAQLKQLKESGTAKEEIEKKVKEFIGEVTDPHKKQIAEEYEAPCKRVYGVGSRKKREHKVEEAKLEEALKTHLSWLTDDQKAEVKTLTSEGKSFEDVQKKVFEYYGALSGEAKDKATQLLQEGCRSLIKELVGEEKANELKKLRESGASKAELKNKIVALMDELTDPEKKEKAVKFAGGCQKVFEVDSARVKREHKVEEAKLEEALKTHLSWLTDDQKAEVKTLTSEGKSFEDVQKKVFEYYGALSGEAKDKATQLLQEGCRSLIKELVGEEKANELKTLRESGASKADLKNKIVALMDELTDPEKKEKAVKFAGGCQKVFEIESARMKRDTKIDDAKFEEALTTHLSWLTDDQKEQLKTLKSEGKSFEDVQKKVFEFYGALSGDSKTKATELLQEGCRSVIKDLVGEEKANELKKLRESGASKTELKEKIVKLMDELTDPEKKEKALKFAGGCQKVFEIESRKKRDVDADKLQQALNTHLSWLTDEQKSTLKTLQSEGKSFTDLNDKVFEWYGQLSGEAQQKAKELLQGGCRALIKELAGDEKAEELKKLRESGASKEEIKNKVVSFLDALTDEDKKKKALKYAPACQKIFDLDSARVKRDEGQGKLEEAFKTHLSWLTEDQKQELRSLKNEGKEFSDMQTKVFGWYEALSGEEKEKATELLKGGCRHLMTEILGEEKAGELKKLKESGTSKDDLKTKVSEFINALTDEEKKAKAKQYAGACEKIFGVSSRKKRDDHDHHGHDHHIDHEKRHAKLEEYFKTHLSWLTDAQKQTLKDLCMQDKTDQELQAKVFEFYEALTDALTDEDKKKKALKYAPACQKIFDLDA
uniref:Polyprotein allergen nematode domain-containing protein n=1 Tax=Acrobeloides nanus TaxID=290746 RepID=A0A914BYZ2_9BILA